MMTNIQPTDPGSPQPPADLLLSNTDALLQISSSLIDVEDLEDAFQTATELWANVLHYDRVKIILFDLERQQVKNVYAGGPGKQKFVNDTFFELWDGLSGWVLRQRRPALSPKGLLDDRESPAAQKRRADAKSGAIVVVPILIQTEIVGTITVINRLEDHDLTQADADILLLMANQVASVIRSHNLFESLSAEARLRRRAQEELLETQSELEIQVQRRTEELRLANRALRTLSSCNQIMIRSTSEQELMTNICQALVTTGGYHLAWIGFVEHDEAKMVRPVAWAGYEDGYLDSLHITWADSERGRGPTGIAARTGEISIIRDIQNDPKLAPWRAQAEIRGYRSSIGLPLRSGEEILGVLNLYSTKVDVFNEDELALLVELSDDLVYGLNALRTRAAQKHLEERFTKAFHANPAALSIVRLSDNLRVDANDSFLRLTGYLREELVGSTTQNINIFPDSDQFSHLKQLFGENGFVRDFETQVRSKNGDIHEVVISIDLIEIAAEPYSITTIIDITERKQMEEALRQSQSKYRLISENAIDVIWTVDIATQRFTFVSPSVEKMLGYTTQEMLQLTITDTLTPESTARARELIAARMEVFLQDCSPRAYTDEMDQIHKNGSIIPAEISTTFAMDEMGRLQVIGVTRDITERQRMERAIRERVKELTCLYQVGRLLEGGSSLDPGQLCAQVVELIVPAMQFPETTAAVIELDGLHTHTALFTPALSNSLAAGIVVGGETRGRIAVCYTDDLPFILPEEQNLLNNLAHMLGLWFERKQSETIEQATRRELEELNRTLERRIHDRTTELRLSRDDLSKSNAELEKASRLKNEFLASMSHELRTPLTGILGLSEALLLNTYGGLNEKQEKALTNIENSGRHLLELINDILDLSKIEAGKLDMQFALCSAENIGQSSLQLIKGMAHQKNLNISLTIDPPSILLRADPRRLKQMLVNLLSNAVKFTPEGGSLGLEIEGDEANQIARFTVWDRGIGIKPEDMSKLFKAFIQIDSSLSRKYSGTGLGLALVQRLTELHGGSVELNSVYGEGSRFTIVLPWVSSESDGASSVILTPFTKNIEALKQTLTIEDNTLDAEHLTRYLNALGVENLVHALALGAVDRAAELQPSVILLDLNLPDGSGMDVLHLLRADARTRGIPVIVTSAIERRSETTALGAEGYLVKPFSLQDLHVELARVAAKTRSMDPVLVIASKSSSRVVMIADDNEVILETLSDFLKSQQYRVEAVRSGFELLEQVGNIKPDILLVDIQMPGMDGMETIRRLRAHSDPQIAAAPIIAVTALTMTGDRELILQAGADEYLSKPISLSLLSQTMLHFLQAKKPGNPL